MKKIILYMCLITCLLSLVACGNNTDNKNISNNEPSKTEQTKLNTTSNQSDSKETTVSQTASETGLSIKDVFTSGNLQYHIMGIRVQEDSAGNPFYTIKLEVYNSSDEEINFSVMERILLEDESGEEVSYAIFGPKEGELNSKILPGNKIIGEIPYEAEDLSGNFTLSFGTFFSDYEKAFVLTPDDMDVIQDSVFENSEIKSAYTIGTPVSSDYFTYTVTQASYAHQFKIFDSDVIADPGKAYLIVHMDVENNTSDYQSFLYSMFIEGFDIEGNGLEFDHVNSYFDTSIDPESTISGYIVWECYDAGEEFYLIVTPDITKQLDTEIILITATPDDTIELE